MPSAVVIGAGVAGLAAARALHDLHYEVEVLESAPSLRTEGAGITLWPNALRALHELGLGEAVEAVGHVVEEGVTLTPEGKTIATAPLDRLRRRFGPLLSLRRVDLLGTLAEEARVPVRFGIRVRFDEGQLSVEGRELSADLIVGADGIGSVVRELIAPGVRARPAGYGAWRGIAEGLAIYPPRVSETLGAGRRFGIVPLLEGRTYWFATFSDAAGDEDLGELFAGWHNPVPTLMALTPGDQRSFLQLGDLPRLPRWCKGSVVLVGDAAHAMTPNLGQGAAQALLDVAVLRRELAAKSIGLALGAYEEGRKASAEQIVSRSRVIGRVGQASHPVARWARDTAAAMVPQAVMAREMGKVIR
jgi:2-polyprenyl-6-methoxyphenol hydroxylase-like FAD-dependent oxidoreductase